MKKIRIRITAIILLISIIFVTPSCEVLIAMLSDTNTEQNNNNNNNNNQKKQQTDQNQTSKGKKQTN